MMGEPGSSRGDPDEAALLAPIERTGPGFYWAVGALSLLIAVGRLRLLAQFTAGSA